MTDAKTAEAVSEAGLAEERSNIYLELGSLLFKSGATCQRVVDSIRRAAELLGDRKPPHVLVEYDALILEGSADRIRMNQARGFAGVDVAVLTAISRFLRGNRPGSLSVEDFRRKLPELAGSPPHYSRPALFLAAVMASIGFDLLNGADLLSLGAIIPAALTVYFLRGMLTRNSFNLYVATLVAVVCGGLVASLGARLTGTLTPQVAFIAPMLFLVPGAPMINGGVDLFRNHNNMGLARVSFTTLIVSMIALGLALACAILPPPANPAVALAKAAPPALVKILADGLLGALAAGGLAMLNNAHRKTLLAFILCGFLARALRAVAMQAGIDIVTSTLIATTLSTLVSTQVARAFFAPAYIMAVVAVLSMVPGLFAIEGLNGLFAIASGPASPELLAATCHSLMKAVFISAALVAGVIIPILLSDRSSPRI